MLPMFTNDACCMAATSENEMCHARSCFRIKAPSPLPLIKGTVAEPHKQLLACMSPHLSDCLRVFRSLFCHLRCLIYLCEQETRMQAQTRKCEVHPKAVYVSVVKYDERFARQYRYEPPSEFPLTSPFTSIVHHLSGPNRRAHTQTS